MESEERGRAFAPLDSPPGMLENVVCVLSFYFFEGSSIAIQLSQNPFLLTLRHTRSVF